MSTKLSLASLASVEYSHLMETNNTATRTFLMTQLSCAIRNSGDSRWIAEKMNARQVLLGQPCTPVAAIIAVADTLTIAERVSPMEGAI